MRKFLLSLFVFCTAVVCVADDFQLPDPHFEDWSGAAFDGNAQPKYWHGSNVSQSALGMTFNFNFTHKESGRSGSCVMVKDQEVGAAGITEVGPGYFSLGYAWQYLEGLNTGSATAGTYGGHAFKHRPDTVSVWIKRTGSNTSKEDFHVLFYSWKGTAKGDAYKNKNGGCTSTTREDEESDIRIALDANECKTTTPGQQIAEGWLRDRKEYTNWVNVRIPIYYLNNDVPDKCNVIFSASNYPNYRANSGLYEGNSLYVDDVELIYSSKIQKLYINEKEWKGFDPNSTEVQYFSLGEGASFPTIEARRGVGSLTNVEGQSTTKTQNFPGRVLSGSEISITKGDLKSTPTKIVVKSEDGKSTTTYLIQFQEAASSNAKLAGVSYTYKDKNNKEQTVLVPGFSPSKYSYTVDLPYGTTSVPKLSVEKQEEDQTVAITDATSPTGSASVVVTAANGSTKATYTFAFRIAELADNTLKDIKVNGNSVLGFTPSQTVYKVSLPTSTQTLKIEPVSEYPAGAQTIVVTPATMPTGEAINGTTVQISVTTPGNTIAKVYKLNIKLEASSYSYLSALWLEGDQVQKVSPASATDPTVFVFNPDQLTYYVNLKMGSTTLPAIHYTRGDEYQKIDISSLGDGVVDGTVRVTVTAGNGDQTVYKLVFSTEKSENSTLTGILIGGDSLKGFAPDKLTYSYALPVGTTELPAIEPIAHDEFQKISVTTAGVNGKTRITVTAGNGNTTIYQITFSVATFSDNTLKALAVEGLDLLNAKGEVTSFDSETNEYWVNIPKEQTSLPKVTYELQNPAFQTASERLPAGVNGDYKITVRPSNGASRTYIIHFSQDKSSNTALTAIYLDNVLIEGFHPDTTHYIDSLKPGDSRIPNVSFTKAESTQRVLSVLENKTQHITVTAESGATREYTIDFIVQMSENAFLDMIYVDSVALEGFRKDSLDYVYNMKGTRCPSITVDKAAGQQVTITTPYASGDAKIKVQPEAGSPNTYTITFKAVATTTVQLSNILIDGVGISGFDATTMDYKASYSGILPTVEGVKKEASQSVSVLWKDSVATLHVTGADGAKAVYSVTFIRQLSSNAKLEGIYADGVLIKGFKPTILNYAYPPLAPGSSYPELSYKAASEAQVVFFGQVSEGKWAVTVLAEDGTQTTYTVQYTIGKYSDNKLQNLKVEGYVIDYAESKLLYDGLYIDEGEALPRVIATPKKGQTVMIVNEDDKTQKVFVVAENGASITYTIKYTRVKSSNALLKDILINGVSLEGFEPTKTDYVDSLAWRSQVVPNVFPIGQLENQTITTYYSKVNGVTKIEVEAQDGTTKKEYYIAFPVRKSGNTALGDLYLDSETADLTYKATQTDYVVAMPYGATACPKIIYEKAESEQRIDVISRPLGQTSEIIVTAENGDKQTYKILFKETLSPEENRLQDITIVETGQKLNLTDKSVFNFDVPMPYGSRSLTVSYSKSYKEQTVFVQPGGILEPTIITVKANRGDEEDVVYKLTPQVNTQNPAVLNSIMVDSVILPEFNPNRFTYIVNRTKSSSPSVIVTRNNGVEYETSSNLHMWKADVTCEGYTNTYQIFFHYPEDIIPNAHFSSWSKTAVTGSDKPTYWNATGDMIDKSYATNSVKKESGTVVHLSTWYDAGLMGAWPAVINLAKMVANNSVAGSSFVEPYSFIRFKNTPDKATVNYKYTTIGGDGALFRFVFFDIDGKEFNFDHRQNSKTDGNYVSSTIDLSTDKKEVVGADIIIDATGRYPKAPILTDNGSGHNSDLYVDFVEFSYNSTPKEAWVNGIKATLSGKAFSVTLTDPEDTNIRSYEFKGEVSDQAQLLSWKEPTKDEDYSIKTASVVNYAEDGSHTDGYSLVVKRPLDTKNKLSNLLLGNSPITGFDASKTDYTVVLLPTDKMPDIMPVPASSLQKVQTTFHEADTTMTITVTPEKGEATVYTIKFDVLRSDDVTLKAITAEGLTPAFSPEQRNYTVTANNLPLIAFEKQSDLQTVSMMNGVITVTAENGATDTYTIQRVDPSTTTDGVITKFTSGVDEIQISGFGGENENKSEAKPADVINFVRKYASDSVVFVQDKEKMQWLVFGNANKTYTWTYLTGVSDNTNLATIMVGGEEYAEYTTGEYSYEILSDTTIVIAPVAGDDKQSLTTTYQVVDGGAVEYTTLVQAENGATKAYKVTVRKPVSSDATLTGILVDGMMIEGFDPSTTDYTVTIPVGAVKTAQPKMPSVTYMAGDEGQTITVKRGQLNGDPTEMTVVSANGKNTNIYSVTINAAKSSCANLTGIIVNDEAIDHFEAGRHFYSVSLNTEEIKVEYTADDRFLKVDINSDVLQPHRKFQYTLNVTAEDGATENYVIEVYVETPSNDAQLANIMLDGKNFVDFERALNDHLAFDAGNKNYLINLPSGTTVWPEVSAQLKMDGQSVAIDQRNDSVLLDVTAKDGVTHNIYALHFVVPKSTNTDLSMIFLNGSELEGFQPDKYFYVVTLKEGEHEMPEVVPQKGESVQTCDTVWDRINQQVAIPVKAEDASISSAYNIVFQFTKSAADTLLAIFADGVKMNGFDPHKLHYTDSLAVGTVAFPELSWEEVNEWQTIRLDTVSMSPDSSQLVRSITVTAENGYSNTYIISYVIRKSEVNTLQMLIVDQKELAGFVPAKEEYYYTLKAAEAAELNGALPKVEFIEGDEYQTVFVAQALDSLSGKSLGYKSVVTVTAANGSSRTYTIHYPVEMSSDATLNMVMLGGKPLSNYDAERFSYKMELGMNDAIPVVSVVKKEDAQTYEIRVEDDTVRIDVWAEDINYTHTYTLAFERLLSSVTILNDIILRDADGVRYTMAQFPFRSDEYTYPGIDIPYRAESDPKDLLPSMEFVLADTLQTVDTVLHRLPNGDIQVEVKVTAANGEDEAVYSLTFHFVKPSDAALAAILVNGEAIEDFDPSVTEYTIKHPYGTAPEDYVPVDSISYVLSDPQAVDTIYMNDEGVICIVVTAQDGTTEQTYMIRQTTSLDGDNALAWITLDNDSLRGFDPDITFYTYYLLPGGAPPAIDAGARSENATVDVREASAGDTCMIICTAADNVERRYYIHFAFTPVDPGVNASSNDVLVKRVPGSMQIMAATVRQGVTFALFDRHGHMVLYERVPVANPNDADVVIGADNEEHLNNVIHSRSGLLVDLIPGEPYFYAFYLNEKIYLGGGKIMGF